MTHFSSAHGTDSIIGVTALAMLYIIRFIFNQLAKRYPNKAKMFFIINTLRVVFVILLYTLITWATQKDKASYTSWRNYRKSKWYILGPVPRGFEYAGVPTITKPIVQTIADMLPATVIVLLIEHIAISKSFGRVNNYIINPSQELIAIGVTNLLGPFLGAFPVTGSFSRTAIKSKAGVRTPLSGIITSIIVLLSLYGLPALFYWIPNAALSAVIIHAVFDLITPPNVLYQFWRINPLEVVIWFAGVIVTVFSTIEDGIYVTISVSAGLSSTAWPRLAVDSWAVSRSTQSLETTSLRTNPQLARTSPRQPKTKLVTMNPIPEPSSFPWITEMAATQMYSSRSHIQVSSSTDSQKASTTPTSTTT